MSTQCVECDKYIQGNPVEPVCQPCSEEVNRLTALEPDEPEAKLKCYKRVNVGHQCIEWFESKTKAAVKRRNQLNTHGYSASIYNNGYTAVGSGFKNITLVLTTPGEHDDTNGMPVLNLEVVNG